MAVTDDCVTDGWMMSLQTENSEATYRIFKVDHEHGVAATATRNNNLLFILILGLLMIRSSSRLLVQSMTMKAATTATTTKMTQAPQKYKYVFHWFRHGDLRLRDNPALMESVQLVQQQQQQSDNDKSCTVVVPLFVFDERVFGKDALTAGSGRPNDSYSYTTKNKQKDDPLKTSPQRAQFIRESVQDLQRQLRDDLGSGLCVAHGEPGAVFDRILSQIKQEQEQAKDNQQMDVTIVCQEEVLKEERDAVKQVQNVLKRHCSSSNGRLRQVWGSTMYELKDLPFESSSFEKSQQQQLLVDMPDTFTPFRNKVEKHCTIQRPLPSPKRNQLPLPTTAKCIQEMLAAPIPTLQELGYTSEQVEQVQAPRDARGVMEFKGGERAALARVKDYIWTKSLLKDYFDTRNGMLGADYSTKLSPWLAHGNISPRTIAIECRKYEDQVVANKSTYWVVFELLWRDYCKFFCLKHGDSIFYPNGITSKQHTWSTHQQNFDAWKNGRTGFPLVDANMREMMATGFMSNRGRQNVASFLAIDLNHDWRWGADWFESQLLDYDVYSNWYNWCAAAGMTGGRLNRFNIVKQSKDYDHNGDYVRTWLPELANVPNAFVHEPWKMTQFQQLEHGCKLGVDYPNPVIPPFSGGRNNNNNKGKNAGGGGNRKVPQTKKQRKPNKNGKSNPHQKFEMKSVKQGNFRI